MATFDRLCNEAITRLTVKRSKVTGWQEASTESRSPCPSHGRDEEWAFVASYSALLPEDAEQRKHPLREDLNSLRYLSRGAPQW
jgi:hypothetical protein